MIATMTAPKTVKEIRTAIRQARYVFVTINPASGTIARISKAEAVHLLRDYDESEIKPVRWQKIEDNLYVDSTAMDE